jgi:hypothetical protein
VREKGRKGMLAREGRDKERESKERDRREKRKGEKGKVSDKERM